MKRHGNLWDKITDIDNIRLAHKQARKGKLFYKEVKEVDSKLDYYCNEIKEMLVNKSFKTSKYSIFEIKEGNKTRKIYKLPYYPDRIVQHALLQVLKPIFIKSFIRDTFQSIDGRGTLDACKRVKKLLRVINPPKYALKVDITKYYPSINNQIMKDKLRKKIKCKNTLWLIDDIVDSIEGMPIGNYTSQYFGNFYLNDFDWFIKQKVKPLGYFRYCDDILFFSNSLIYLFIVKIISEYLLGKINLDIKNKWKVYNVYENGVDFVGYVFYPTKTILRKSIAFNFKKKIRYIKKVINKDNSKNLLNSLMAYKGWINTINGKMLWRKYTNSLIKHYPLQLKKHL